MNLDAMIESVAEQAIWPQITKGLYGEGHWRRTFLLAERIMETVGGHNGIVGYAALCHDIGRVNYAQDRNHGYRGASLAMRIAANGYAQSGQAGLYSTNEFNGMMVILGKITDIVSRHSLDHRPDYLEFQIVHDANVLDRVRHDGRKSIDVDHFAIPEVSEPLIDYALELLEGAPEDGDRGKLIQIEKKLVIPKGKIE